MAQWIGNVKLLVGGRHWQTFREKAEAGQAPAAAQRCVAQALDRLPPRTRVEGVACQLLRVKPARAKGDGDGSAA
jgi:hypothetical protein